MKLYFHFLIFCFFCVSCTPSYTPTLVNSQTTCRNNTEIKFQEFSFPDNKAKNKLLFILLDIRNDGDYFEKIKANIINDVLPSVEPGDKLIILVTGKRSNEFEIFNEVIEKLPSPSLLPSINPPTPVPTPTQDSEMTSTQKGLQLQTSEAIDRINQSDLGDYYCNIEAINTENGKTIKAWQDEQIAMTANFASSVQNTLNEISIDDSIDESNLFEILNFISKINEEEAGERSYDKTFLVMYSSFEEIAEDNSKIDLRGIKTVIVTPNCKHNFNCKVKAEWEGKLKRFGAVQPIFTETVTANLLVSGVECSINENIEYTNFDFKSHKPRYYFILVDRSSTYIEYTNEALSLIKKSVVNGLQGGDRIIITWLGPRPSDDSILVDERIRATDPPSFIPTLVPELSTPCAIEEINLENEDILMEWERQQEVLQLELADRVDSSIIEVTKDQATNGKFLYESLYFASDHIQANREKNPEADFFLILFSDMYEWRTIDNWIASQGNETPGIDLTGVDVIIVPQNCKFSTSCNVEDVWSGQFLTFGAMKLKYLYQEDNIEEALVKALRVP